MITKMQLTWTVTSTDGDLTDQLKSIVQHVQKLGITTVEISADLSELDMNVPQDKSEVAIARNTWQWTPAGA